MKNTHKHAQREREREATSLHDEHAYCVVKDCTPACSRGIKVRGRKDLGVKWSSTLANPARRVVQPLTGLELDAIA